MLAVRIVSALSSLLLLHSAALGPKQVELRPLNTSAWAHAKDRNGRSPKASDQRRSYQQNRPYTTRAATVDWSVKDFITNVDYYDLALKLNGKTRDDMEKQPGSPELIQRFEDKLVSVTGYLVAAYSGGADLSNYNNAKYNDWRLELYARVPSHVPAVGGPTPLICVITRFTEQKLYQKGVRLQPLIAEWREDKGSKAIYHPTGHAAHRVRITGYFLWNDQHNVRGKDIGPWVKTIDPATGLAQPSRQTAWEIHPVTNIEDLG